MEETLPWFLSTQSPFLADGAELITSPPPPDSPLAYNEDELVSLIKEIYDLHLRLCYLLPDDVVFPPENGRHALDASHLRDKLHMGPRVVSLLERIPYVVDAVNRELPIFFEAVPVNYLEESNLKESRDPDNYNRHKLGRQRPDVHYLRSEDLALTFPWGSVGATWILDIEANSIRVLHDRCEPPIPGESEEVPPTYTLERPDQPDHYRNFPAFHAPIVLRNVIQKIRSLELLPNDGVICFPKDTINDFIVARKLHDDYGWPDNFRASDWAREWEQVRDEAQAENDRVLADVAGLERHTVTQQWIREHESIGHGHLAS